MDIKELAKGFITGVSGMCEKGQGGLMNSSSIDDLVTEYWKGIDFCLAKDYPRMRVMKRFQNEFRKQHVYLDETVKIENIEKTVFLGLCYATFIANDYSVCRIYVKHASKLNIKASDNSYVMVDALNTSDVIVECTENAKVIVNLYSNAASVGATKVVHKNIETYEL